ncbi:PHP domain-containing protein [bacterium]|nr:PHP domain-containing protein [bacterium]
MGILSEKEFIERVKNFSEKSFKVGEREFPEIVDTNDTEYVETGDFCANLHIHTQYSDGIMSIPELLSETKKYKNVLVAITDHDTVDGCKEARKINDKEVDLVLGTEISTIAINFPKQPKPLPIHLLVYGIDPFNKKLNEYLDYKRDLKLQLAKDTVKKLNEALPEYDFSMEEASLCHPMILKGQDEIAHPLKKYTSGKILLNHYFPNADFSYEEPIFKFKYLFKGLESYFITYKKALEMYTNCSLPLIPDEIIGKIYKARDIYTQSHPSIGKMLDAFSSFEDAVEFFAQFGVLSIAHPARTKAYTPEFYNYLFYNFKRYGKEKAKFYEKYYQSYDGSYYKEWESIIDRAAEGLIPTGGIDSHGHNILYRSSHY